MSETASSALYELAAIKTSRFSDLGDKLKAQLKIETKYGKDAYHDAQRQLEEYISLATVLNSQSTQPEAGLAALMEMTKVNEETAKLIFSCVVGR